MPCEREPKVVMSKQACHLLLTPHVHYICLQAVSIHSEQVSIRRHLSDVNWLLEVKIELWLHILQVIHLHSAIVGGCK